MTQENELKRLEVFVSKLLKSFQELKEEHSRVLQDLQMRDETIVSLKEQLATNDSERNEISTRVSGIIEQIEEWELNLGEEVLDEVPVNDTGRQGNLFSAVAASSTEK
jgi:seryl-tRNA synthetase